MKAKRHSRLSVMTLVLQYVVVVLLVLLFIEICMRSDVRLAPLPWDGS